MNRRKINKKLMSIMFFIAALIFMTIAIIQMAENNIDQEFYLTLVLVFICTFIGFVFINNESKKKDK